MRRVTGGEPRLVPVLLRRARESECALTASEGAKSPAPSGLPLRSHRPDGINNDPTC